jgi:hypothetical protein
MEQTRRAAVALVAALACIAFVAVVLPEDGAQEYVALTPAQKAEAKKIGQAAKAPKTTKVKFAVPKKSMTSTAIIARVKKAAKKAAKLTPFQKNCMALKEYAYASIDDIVELPEGEGGIAAELAQALVNETAQEKLNPEKVPVWSLTPEACVKQYKGFIKNATATAEVDSIPYFQLKAIRHSMEKGSGILTTFKSSSKPAVITFDGKSVGLDGTPSGWIEHLGQTQAEIGEVWKQVLPKKKALIIQKKREKVVFGQKEFDLLFKPYCGEVDTHTNINMGCSSISSPVKCHQTAGCEWQGPWDGDVEA